jgi:HPt (histidine-containing phosphotransfer) domain-containing protein
MSAEDGTREAGSPVDRSVLAEMCGGDDAFERRILGNFRQTTRADAARLSGAIASGDLAAVTRVAHSIKGAARTIGAQDLAAVCERIESAARAADADTVAANSSAFNLENSRVDEYLEAVLRPDSSPRPGP